MKRNFLLLVIGLLSLPCFSQNTDSRNIDSRNADSRIARIDSFMTSLATHQLFNGNVLVTEQGKPVYQKSFGYFDRANRVVHSDTTRFNLASVSKPFTAIAVLQLVEKGKIALDEPLRRYFDDFAYPDITIRHLLNQTSGLPVLERYEEEYVQAHPDELITNQQAYAHLMAAKLPLLFKSGENWRYNNANYALLALLVEKVSGMPFHRYMRERVFEPANMQHSYVRLPGMRNTTRYVRTNMYTQVYTQVDSLDRTREYTYYNLGALSGPGNVVSTLADLQNFDRALHGEKLISRKTMEEAFKPLVLNSGKTFFMGASTRSYGLGWNVYTSKTAPFDRFAFHDGHIVGLSTVLHKNLSRDQTILLYDNADNNPIQVMIGVSNILNGAAPPSIRLTKSLARIYGETLATKGADAAAATFNALKNDSAHYHVDELEINRLGFDLLRAESPVLQACALEVFKINTLLFPKSGNAYDSYAHALAKLGKKEPAIAMYRKSIALSPGNEDGKKALEKLIASDR